MFFLAASLQNNLLLSSTNHRITATLRVLKIKRLHKSSGKQNEAIMGVVCLRPTEKLWKVEWTTNNCIDFNDSGNKSITKTLLELKSNTNNTTDSREKEEKNTIFCRIGCAKIDKKTQTFLKSNNVNCSRAVLCASVQCACVVSAGRWNIHW